MRITSDLVKLGTEILFDVYDSRGKLVLRKGTVIPSQRHLTNLLDQKYYSTPYGERGNSIDYDWDDHGSSSKSVAYFIESLIIRLDEIYSNFMASGYNLTGDIGELADILIHQLQHEPDITIGVVHLHTKFPYPVMRMLQSAVFAILVALRSEWKTKRIQSLARACLTQNIGMFPLQFELSEVDGSELSDSQRQQIRLHPKRSVSKLIAMGVKNQAWIDAVAAHHEKIDGSGYPLGCFGYKISQEARLLAIVDRYGSMISPRSQRASGVSTDVMRNFLVAKKVEYDMKLSKALISELGIYPPGSTVLLSSGEVALVTKRGKNGLHPEVFSIWDSNGGLLSSPQKRALGTDETRILSIKKHEDAERLNVDLFWGSSAGQFENQPLLI